MKGVGARLGFRVLAKEVYIDDVSGRITIIDKDGKTCEGKDVPEHLLLDKVGEEVNGG